MNSEKTLSVVIVLVALLGIYMHSRHILRPAIGVVVEANNTIDKVSANTESLGKLALAAFVYLVFLSFMNSKEGFYLTLLVVIGALVIDEKNNGSRALLNTLLD